MAQRGRFRGLGRLAVPAAVVAVAVLPATAVPAPRAPSEPVVHTYDVQVTGVVRTTYTLPAKPLPLDVGWSETSTWTETYKGVKLTVQPQELLPASPVAMRIEGKGAIAGVTRYTASGPRVKGCVWKTSRPESAQLRLTGTPYAGAVAGAVRYKLDLATGRSRTGAPQKRPGACPYLENPRWAKFDGVQLGAGVAAGWVDTRSLALGLELRKPQQKGRLDFPLNRLNAGAGFVLMLKGKTTEQSGRFVSEGTARVTFVPRPS